VGKTPDFCFKVLILTEFCDKRFLCFSCALPVIQFTENLIILWCSGFLWHGMELHGIIRDIVWYGTVYGR
jgi:hypothetical protein